MNQRPLNRRLKALLRAVAAGAIVGALVWHLGTDAFLAGLGALSTGPILAALGAGIVWTVCSAARWRLVARQLGVWLPWSTAVADSYRAQFLNMVLPTGLLGDVHRAVSHGHQVGDLARGARVVALERLAGQVVLVGAALVLLASQPALIATVVPNFSVGLGAAVTVSLVFVVFGGALAVWCLNPQGRWRRMLAIIWRDVRAGLLEGGVWVGVVLLSVATLAGYVVLFVVAARSTGTTAPILVLLPLLLAALVGMSVPVSVGGWGPREAVAVAAFGAVGLGAANGLSTAVAYGVLSAVAVLPGLAVLVTRRYFRDAAPQCLASSHPEDAAASATIERTGSSCVANGPRPPEQTAPPASRSGSRVPRRRSPRTGWSPSHQP